MSDPLRRRLRAACLGAASASSGLVPEWLARGGLRGASWLSRFSQFEERTRANLELAYGATLSEAEKERIAAGVRAHASRQFYEWLRMARGACERAWMEDLVEVDDSIAILEEEVAKERGVLVVTAHLGNWELLAATLVRRGMRGAVVGLERRRDPSSAWLMDMRRAHGVETIPQHTSPRALVRVLEDEGVLGLLCDLEVRRLAGEFLPFFGHPALTMTAPAALARTRRLPLVPVRCVLPTPDARRYVLSVEPPLPRDRTLGRREATLDHMGRVNQIFERWIRETPEQWAWHQPRWRTQPGEWRALPLGAR